MKNLSSSSVWESGCGGGAEGGAEGGSSEHLCPLLRGMVNGSAAEGACPAPEPVDYTRLVTVLIGAPFGLGGILTNGLLIFLFAGRKYRASPTLYLAVLATLDVAICAMYVLIFPVDALAIYHGIEWLWVAWHKYSMLLYSAARITHLASTYLVICATLERFLLTFKVRSLRFLYSAVGRRFLIAFVLITSTALRVPSYFEYSVTEHPQCTAPFSSYSFQPNLILHTGYRETYNFVIMNIVQVFLPFALLLLLNAGILMRMRHSEEEAEDGGSHEMTAHHNSNGHPPPSAQIQAEDSWRRALARKANRRRLKSVTYTIVAIVTSYLICGSFDLMIKILENVGGNTELLMQNGQATTFYRLSTDIISILFTLNSFIRLFIYLLCSSDIRSDLKFLFCPIRTTLGDDVSPLRKKNRLGKKRSSDKGAAAAAAAAQPDTVTVPVPVTHRRFSRASTYSSASSESGSREQALPLPPALLDRRLTIEMQDPAFISRPGLASAYPCPDAQHCLAPALHARPKEDIRCPESQQINPPPALHAKPTKDADVQPDFSFLNSQRETLL